MGGVSGSANADAAMQSKMLVPEMEKRGYSRAFSVAVTAALSSASTPVIPPGINLIIYALIASVSVTKMFMAGYVPGILMAVSMMIVVAIVSKKRGYKPSREKSRYLRRNYDPAERIYLGFAFPLRYYCWLTYGYVYSV